MSLAGIDVSTYQTSATVASWLPKIGFGIVKASEGVSTKDRMHDTHCANLRIAGKEVGHYHYAHPSRNSAQAEAAAFLAAAQARVGEVLVLDFEPYNQGGAVGNYPEWILAFAAYVKAKTGAPCWLYLNGDWMTQILAAATPAQDAALRELPLWKAEYYYSARPAAPKSLGGWPVWTCWQYSDRPLDLDIFNGDASTWRALGVPSAGASKPTGSTTGKTTTPPQEADMPLTPADITAVWRADVIPSPTKAAANPTWQPDSYLREIYLQVQAGNQQIAALTAAVHALAASNGADPAAILEAVKARLAEITFSVSDGKS